MSIYRLIERKISNKYAEQINWVLQKECVLSDVDIEFSTIYWSDIKTFRNRDKAI